MHVRPHRLQPFTHVAPVTIVHVHLRTHTHTPYATWLHSGLYLTALPSTNNIITCRDFFMRTAWYVPQCIMLHTGGVCVRCALCAGLFWCTCSATRWKDIIYQTSGFLALMHYSVELSMINKPVFVEHHHGFFFWNVVKQATAVVVDISTHQDRKSSFRFVASCQAVICQQEARRSLSCFKLTCKISICL